MKKLEIFWIGFLLFTGSFFLTGISFGQENPLMKKAPLRSANEGLGPYPQLIIRNATLIDGTLAPPIGPVDIVIKNNRIVNIIEIGDPNAPDDARHPKLEEGGKELDVKGMYVLPGFVDTHMHIGGNQAPIAEYVFKIIMAHGITTIAEPGSMNGLGWVLEEKKRSQQNKIVAPRIRAYTVFGQQEDNSRKIPQTPEEAIQWVNNNAKKGADGIKFFGGKPEVLEVAIKENKRLGLRSMFHHAQMSVGRWNVVNSAKAGLTSMEHWYGLPEALFSDRLVQHYSLDYNYNDESDRFAGAGELWKQAAKPGSKRWNEVRDTLIALDFTLTPTFTPYSANRDFMRARRAEWHEKYTLPSLWEFFKPTPGNHGSYWFNWGTEQEIEWKNNYRLWMKFINDYKNHGGRVAVGTDSGFIYQVYGFSFPFELEMYREAGFHPLEIINSATLKGAESLGMEKDVGSVEIGKKADFVIVHENPLENLKVLYGTGSVILDGNNTVTRTKGIQYTIKDGIIYDAKKLLEDVKAIVEEEKAKNNNYKITQPGLDY